MRRREFIAALGGATVAWPLVARAQQTERVRRIGFLLPATADDAELGIHAGTAAIGLEHWTQPTGRHPMGNIPIAR